MKLYRFTDLSTGRTERFANLYQGTKEFNLPKTTVYDRLKMGATSTIVRDIKVEVIDDMLTNSDSTGFTWYTSLTNTYTEDSREVIVNLPMPVKQEGSRILVIGDTHIPFTMKGYLQFCIDTAAKYNCNIFVSIGDLVDYHYSSFHESDPDGLSAGQELTSSIKQLESWYKAFPTLKICLGSHDLRPQRKTYSGGISKQWLRGFNEVYNTPTWEFADKFEIDDILFTHEPGKSGITGAYSRALYEGKSVVCGHLHGNSSIIRDNRVFGMFVGCGVDDTTYAMAYAKNFLTKSVLSCAVIIDGIPTIIPFK